MSGNSEYAICPAAPETNTVLFITPPHPPRVSCCFASNGPYMGVGDIVVSALLKGGVRRAIERGGSCINRVQPT